MPDTLFAITRAAEFRRELLDLLVDICRIDTTPRPNPAEMRTAEAAVFDRIETYLDAIPFPRARRERRPVDPAIARHPAFSKLHFTKTPERPQGLTPEETYAGRANLLYFVEGPVGSAQPGLALNAHIDVVAPYFPPRLDGNILYGRGSCDDKGAVAAMLGALRAVAAYLERQGKKLEKPLTAMIVIEEETGGNGSLSLALDRELRKRYETMMVLECCDNGIYPANRGAVWYKFEIRTAENNTNDFELAAFLIEELENEGRAIRAESRHPLFPQRPVQTCQGILDHYGEHPSRICGEFAFDVLLPETCSETVERLVRDILDFAVREYCGLYGDKTRDADPVTGKPKVEKHYEASIEDRRITVRVFGATGHMGSILENDDAITKAAWMARNLVRSRDKLEAAAGGPVTLDVHDRRNPDVLVLEGGQGFVPTHPIQEIMERMARAARRGAANYLVRTGASLDPERAIQVSYDKLHNDAFDGDPDSQAMRDAVAAAQTAGIWSGGPVSGWTVSCDARLFAREYPGLPVLTSGPGRLADAHSDHERLVLDDFYAAIEFLALFILKHTGTADLTAANPRSNPGG